MKRFIKGILAIMLILVIVAGMGYFGYNYLFLNQFGESSMSGHSQAYSNDYKKDEADAPLLDSMNTVMANKESLSKAISRLKESITFMTLDPYAPNSNEASAVSIQENTSTNDNASVNMSMKNMGTKYKADRMEQLHLGLYKLSVGMQLLEHLNDDLSIQAEHAALDVKEPLQHYTNQYNLTLQNKNKLSQAITYINEAASLVNINPYVDENGMVYDIERMQKIHESIVKMAEGVVSLNMLSDEMTKQAVDTSVKVQNYMNIANTNTNTNVNANANIITDNVNNNAATGVSGGALGKINVPTLINIILIMFVGLFIFGLMGFVFSLLKPKQAY